MERPKDNFVPGRGGKRRIQRAELDEFLYQLRQVLASLSGAVADAIAQRIIDAFCRAKKHPRGTVAIRDLKKAAIESSRNLVRQMDREKDAQIRHDANEARKLIRDRFLNSEYYGGYPKFEDELFRYKFNLDAADDLDNRNSNECDSFATSDAISRIMRTGFIQTVIDSSIRKVAEENLRHPSHTNDIKEHVESHLRVKLWKLKIDPDRFEKLPGLIPEIVKNDVRTILKQINFKIAGSIPSNSESLQNLVTCSVSAMEQVVCNEEQTALFDAIDQLGPLDAEIIQLKFFDQCTGEEIAEQINRCRSTVTKRCKHALEKLRELLS